MPKLLNKIIRTLIISEFFLNSGWGMVSPVFAIFIVKNIAVANPSGAVKVAGFAALFFWMTKSILQIPIGRYLDKNHGEKDDFWFMIIGTFMMAFVPLGYLISSQPWHIYALQMFYGMAAAMVLPSFAAIFTRHINKGKEAFTWSTYSTFLGFAMGISGGIGGIMGSFFGFNVVFIFVSAFTMLAVLLLLIIKNDISFRNKKAPRIPLEKK